MNSSAGYPMFQRLSDRWRGVVKGHNTRSPAVTRRPDILDRTDLSRDCRLGLCEDCPDAGLDMMGCSPWCCRCECHPAPDHAPTDSLLPYFSPEDDRDEWSM